MGILSACKRKDIKVPSKYLKGAKQRLTITASQAGTVTNDLKRGDSLRAREDALRLHEVLKTDT